MVTLLIAALVAGCSSQSSNSKAPADKPTAWKFALEEVKGSHQDIYASKFKEVIEKKTNGKIKINIYYIGQLGDGSNQAELIQNGAIELGFMSAGATGPLVPESNMFMMHFLFPDKLEDSLKLLQTSKAINEKISAAYLKKGFRVIDWDQEGYMMWTGNKPLRNPDDFKGFKMRTMAAPIISTIYQSYGANPVAMPFSEVYSSLQLKMADGQTNPITLIDDMKFYEVQQYMTDANSDLAIQALCASEMWWKNVSPETQKLVLDTIKEIKPYYHTEQAKKEKASLDKMIEKGLKVITLTKEEREVFRNLSAAAKDKFIQIGGPNAKEILTLFLQESEPYFKK